MAETLKFVKRNDYSGDIDDTDLLGSDGIYLSDWEEQIIAEDENGVIETALFRIEGANDNGLATTLKSIFDRFNDISKSHDLAERYQLWIRDCLTGESNARQAVIKSIKGEQDFQGNGLHSFIVRDNHKTFLSLGFERGHWEAQEYLTSAANEVSSVGGLANIHSGSSVSGDLPARISRFSFISGSASGNISEVWFGLRTSKNGTLGNWKGLWELENGTAGTDTQLAADATASPGGSGSTVMRCNFATNQGMATRVTLTPYQIDSTNYEDFRGTYQIVARAQVDSGYVCRARIGFGLGTTGITWREAVTVESTDWLDFDLGRITLPAGGEASLSAMKNSAVYLQAQLYSGSQVNTKYLRMDCLQAVPVDEGYGHLSGATTGDTGLALIDAVGHIAGFSYSGADIAGYMDTRGLNAKNCSLPIGVSKIFVVAQQDAASALSDKVNISLDFFSRYRMLRGNT